MIFFVLFIFLIFIATNRIILDNLFSPLDMVFAISTITAFLPMHIWLARQKQNWKQDTSRKYSRTSGGVLGTFEEYMDFVEYVKSGERQKPYLVIGFFTLLLFMFLSIIVSHFFGGF